MGNYNSSEQNNRFAKLTKRTRKVQAKKSTRRMPWHWEPKKDVTSCDKLRGAANELRSVDVRMRKLNTLKMYYRILNT